MDGWRVEGMDGWMDGWIDGWMNGALAGSINKVNTEILKYSTNLEHKLQKGERIFKLIVLWQVKI